MAGHWAISFEEEPLQPTQLPMVPMGMAMRNPVPSQGLGPRRRYLWSGHEQYPSCLWVMGG